MCNTIYLNTAHAHTRTLFTPPGNRYDTIVSRGRGRRSITLKSSANIKLYVLCVYINIIWTGINNTKN